MVVSYSIKQKYLQYKYHVKMYQRDLQFCNILREISTYNLQMRIFQPYFCAA